MNCLGDQGFDSDVERRSLNHAGETGGAVCLGPVHISLGQLSAESSVSPS